MTMDRNSGLRRRKPGDLGIKFLGKVDCLLRRSWVEEIVGEAAEASRAGAEDFDVVD